VRRIVPLVFALALCLPAAPATAQDRSETTHDKTATIDFLDVGQERHWLGVEVNSGVAKVRRYTEKR
jgi:hypothetical protein